MKKKSTLLFLALFLYLFSYAQQITTDNTQQPNTLIQNLVGSDCITVDNIASPVNGQSNAIVSYGTFYKDNSNFPLQSGLILSTGRVNSAGNTTISEDLNEGQIDWGTDPDLLDVVGIDQTLNATTIEFDFSSPNNFIAFNYLFASDEYQQEYPCNFKDVFAILIKEVGSADPYVNIAVVPETATEVSTSSIHPNITGFCEAENETYFEGYNVGDTNFNGRTAVLTARADINANTNYHIKFIIADH
ncbi:MAG: choice-of-anchor L domain-containing protein, partial [Winogradskyella arenosi]